MQPIICLDMRTRLFVGIFLNLKVSAKFENPIVEFAPSNLEADYSGKVRGYWKIFTSQKKIFQISILRKKYFNKLFAVMGGKFKFSAQDSDLEYIFGGVKLFQYLLTLSHL